MQLTAVRPPSTLHWTRINAGSVVHIPMCHEIVLNLWFQVAGQLQSRLDEFSSWFPHLSLQFLGMRSPAVHWNQKKNIKALCYSGTLNVTHLDDNNTKSAGKKVLFWTLTMSPTTRSFHFTHRHWPSISFSTLRWLISSSARWRF